MTIEPYLFFNGNCETAVEFYKQALGGRSLADDALQRQPGPATARHGAAALG